MIYFLLKGIWRDRSRSFFPILVTAMGVLLTVFLSGFMQGVFNDIIEQNARLETGHLKVMSRAYAELASQKPNDLALYEADSLLAHLRQEYPELIWTPRLRFGGLVDLANAQGETKAQGPANVTALDLSTPSLGEAQRLNLQKSLYKGRLPEQPQEVLMGEEFARRLGIELGQSFSLMGSTMEGSMSFRNYQLVGVIRFGVVAIDRSSLIMNLADAEDFLDMQDAAAEILGYFKHNSYSVKQAKIIAEGFNAAQADNPDEFAPIMLSLRAQNNLGQYVDYANNMSTLIIGIFVLAMSIVLWNMGLLGGLRRYKEFGIRLALGEAKGQIYAALCIESLLIGGLGSFLGTLVGLGLCYYLQLYGIDLDGALEQSNVMMPSVFRAKLTVELLYIGFIPGLLASLLGSMLAGLGIYQRSTANLFKELEA
ncbi:ABC-type transport system, involved in lipoprotein release, permease component [Saprospira grandis DSM 2844]|uniref:ABC-type transport system, involved in lipoprotein release, permease component n=1 Tax=Saprospira grandis DSM 2844 TaxID=694433 RepID=J0P4H5_9BACT|nr:FtsX-like permease family protein [Saprospira grandis]EJF52327.1 ABC-type transport system, involved in lipoprotein release, permease component [Saprospira grandis DSM 2844]